MSNIVMTGRRTKSPVRSSFSAAAPATGAVTILLAAAATFFLPPPLPPPRGPFDESPAPRMRTGTSGVRRA